MSQRSKQWLKFFLRWGIAVIGVGYVVWNISINDRAIVLDPQTQLPVYVQVVQEPDDEAPLIEVIGRDEAGNRLSQFISHSDIWVPPDRSSVTVQGPQIKTKYKLLAIKPGDSHTIDSIPSELLVKNPETGNGMRLQPDDVLGGFKVAVPYPYIERGLRRTVRGADWIYLLAAIAIFPVTYLLTSYRWNELLKALDIRLGQGRTFILNMVGSFYNSFMPGSTGGDLLKAYYASKHTVHRTRAVMSVLIDRVIGLMALIILGGTMAALQWGHPDCRRVALMSAGILARLPMQKQISSAVQTMEIYRRRPLLVLWTLIVTFPVHITVILSATLAGEAFNLPLNPFYYWVVVPVIVLVGSIPISPQGFGVMEYFAVELTRRHGVTVSQAIALTMSIRLVQLLWNLVGGVFVFRGGYQPPTEKEQDTLQSDAEPAKLVTTENL